ncbi:hypothetical protein H5410_041467 [Solanum commersonii]|uniref:Uncharacterized protein n=1 Tax=Solanum commersonii TaxID=4109 RepID=A0A9J5XRY9_SOLCO|nr:hypothetical protein H5410_041467 [Solanum commersonii]
MACPIKTSISSYNFISHDQTDPSTIPHGEHGIRTKNLLEPSQVLPLRSSSRHFPQIRISFQIRVQFVHYSNFHQESPLDFPPNPSKILKSLSKYWNSKASFAAKLIVSRSLFRNKVETFLFVGAKLGFQLAAELWIVNKVQVNFSLLCFKFLHEAIAGED